MRNLKRYGPHCPDFQTTGNHIVDATNLAIMLSNKFNLPKKEFVIGKSKVFIRNYSEIINQINVTDMQQSDNTQNVTNRIIKGLFLMLYCLLTHKTKQSLVCF